jgi:guanyl-specific ribonuclease Sa
MLLRTVMMLAIAVVGLALAACAETGGALATEATADAASIAATQAAIATTQAIEAIESASNQMSSAQANANAGSLPQLPPVGKGTLIVDTPTALIVQKNGQRYIFLKPPPDDNGDADH